jgi:hypothetical protein
MTPMLPMNRHGPGMYSLGAARFIADAQTRWNSKNRLARHLHGSTISDYQALMSTGSHRGFDTSTVFAD